MTRDNLAVDAVLIVSTVGGERGHRTVHLIEQGTDLRGIVDVVGGQRGRLDLPGVGVHSDVQLAPGPPCLRSVLLEQSFAGAAEFQPVLSTSRCTGPEPGRGQTTSKLSARRLKVVCSGTARSMPSMAMMEPISPSVCKGQAEHGSQRQRRRNSQGRIARLTTSRRPRFSLPGRDRRVGEADRQAAALPQARVVGRRVRDR